MLALRILPLPSRALALALVLICTTLVACGDDDPTGPSTNRSSPDVAIRLSHLVVFGTCEGTSGFDQTGDFIVAMQVFGPDGELAVSPDPPAGGPNDLFEGDFREIVPLELEYVLDGALADVAFLRIEFEVYERDGPTLFDDRMFGTRGEVTFQPNGEGSWEDLTGVAGIYGSSPCGLAFVVTLDQ